LTLPKRTYRLSDTIARASSVSLRRWGVHSTPIRWTYFQIRWQRIML